MGFLDRLFGRRRTGRDDSYQYVQPPPSDQGGREHGAADLGQQAPDQGDAQSQGDPGGGDPANYDTSGDPADYDTPGDSGDSGDSGGGGDGGGDGGGGGGD